MKSLTPSPTPLSRSLGPLSLPPMVLGLVLRRPDGRGSAQPRTAFLGSPKITLAIAESWRGWPRARLHSHAGTGLLRRPRHHRRAILTITWGGGHRVDWALTILRGSLLVNIFLKAQKLPVALYSCILITKCYLFSRKLTFFSRYLYCCLCS